MSLARTAFLERLDSFGVAILEPGLISRDPSQVGHNNTARLLRNGLAVAGFALLEDFIRSRTQEVLERLSSGQLPFDSLPDELREACVFGATKAVAYHGDIKKRQHEDYLSFIQEHGRLIGSTSSSGYQLSPMSLGWERPNLNHDDVKEILRAFKIKDGWGNIDSLAARVGLASPSLCEAFRQSALRRHRAAHKADVDTETSQLDSFVSQALGIAIAFDALISKSLRRLLDRDSTFLSDSGDILHSDVSVRFLDKGQDGWWREMKENGQRAVRRTQDVVTLKSECLARADARRDLIVIRKVSQQPTEWLIPEVD